MEDGVRLSEGTAGVQFVLVSDSHQRVTVIASAAYLVETFCASDDPDGWLQCYFENSLALARAAREQYERDQVEPVILVGVVRPPLI